MIIGGLIGIQGDIRDLMIHYFMGGGYKYGYRKTENRYAQK
jgi:hypothetical protein